MHPAERTVQLHRNRTHMCPQFSFLHNRRPPGSPLVFLCLLSCPFRSPPLCIHAISQCHSPCSKHSHQHDHSLSQAAAALLRDWMCGNLTAAVMSSSRVMTRPSAPCTAGCGVCTALTVLFVPCLLYPKMWISKAGLASYRSAPHCFQEISAMQHTLPLRLHTSHMTCTKVCAVMRKPPTWRGTRKSARGSPNTAPMWLTAVHLQIC